MGEDRWTERATTLIGSVEGALGGIGVGATQALFPISYVRHMRQGGEIRFTRDMVEETVAKASEGVGRAYTNAKYTAGYWTHHLGRWGAPIGGVALAANDDYSLAAFLGTAWAVNAFYEGVVRPVRKKLAQFPETLQNS